VPLKRMCLGDNNLLLIYSDACVRLWDTQTKELWRSMTQDKAEELLAQGGWTDLWVLLRIIVSYCTDFRITGCWKTMDVFPTHSGNLWPPLTTGRTQVGEFLAF